MLTNRKPFLTAATAILLIGLAGPTPAQAANEKGPRCSDGIDNDLDGKIDCDSGNEDPDCNCGDGDGGDGTASDLFVRADFQDVLSDDATPTAIQSDLEGADPPNPNAVNACGDYQYWDTLFDQTCQNASGSGPVSSTVSNGGRWHLHTVRESDESSVTDNRWMVFNWSESPAGSPCPITDPVGGLDAVLYPEGPPPPLDAVVVPPIHADPCIDNLEMRFLHCLDKVFAPGTTEDDVCIDLVGPKVIKQGGVLWRTFYTLTYLEPLFVLEDPDNPGNPDARILTTKDGGVDRSEAELVFTNDTPRQNDDVVIGTYNMHLKVKLWRVHCPPDGSECPPAPSP